jgi:predicted transcriptional regulator
MKQRIVAEIVVPIYVGVPRDISVSATDSIMRAVELMVNRNLSMIAVVHNERPIGIIRLEDAFKALGLREAGK